MRCLALGGMVAILLGCPVTGTATSQPEPANRIGLWHEATVLLDAGRNVEAVDLLRPLVARYPHRLELAGAYFRAQTRRCDVAADDDIRTEPLASFRDGFIHRKGNDFAAAASSFETAAQKAAAGGDTLSFTVAALEAVDCLALAAQRDHARALLDDLNGPLARRPAWRRPTARALQLRGALAVLETEHAEAVPILRKAIDLTGPGGDPLVLFECWHALGVEDRGYYRQALAAAERARDPARMVRALVNLAFTSPDKGPDGEAWRHVDRADSILARCDLPYLAGYVPAMRGIILGSQFQRPAAIAQLQLAHRLHTAGNNPRGQVTSQQWLAFHLQMSGRYLEAQAHLEDCLRILEERDSHFIRNWILLGLANINRILGHVDKAIALYGQAAAHYERGPERDRGVALCLNETGMCHALKGEYRQALLIYEEAAAIQRTIGDGRVSDYVLTNMADAYFHLGDYNEALDHYERALDRLGVSADDTDPSRGSFALSRIAALYGATDHPDRAAAVYRRALKLARSVHVRETELDCLIGLGAQEVTAGCGVAARNLLDEAGSLLASEGQFAYRARIGLLRARVTADPARALSLAREALAAAATGGLPEEEWNCLTEIGELHLALGDTNAAITAQEEAIGVIESLRRRVGADELSRHLLAPAIVPYERLIDILLTTHAGGPHASRALAVSERSRSRILAERLERNLTRTHDPTYPGATARQRELRAAMTRALDRLQEPGLAATERRQLRADIAAMEQQFALLQADDAARGDGVGLARSPLRDDPRTLVATLRPEERVLAYFLGTRRSVLFSVTRDGVVAHPLPARDVIEERVRLFLGLRQTVGEEAPPLPAAVREVSERELHALLLGPVADCMAPGERLIIVPDGALHRLPFALLNRGDGGLIADHEVIHAPSLFTLAQLRDRDRLRRDEPERGGGHVLAVGCACAPCPDRPARVHPFTDGMIPPLPHADQEAAVVAAMYNRSRLLGSETANEATVKTALGAGPDIVHIAAHGYADPRHPERSFMVLDLPCEAGPDVGDGLLQWHEIVSLRLESSLVVLSACHSAGGPLAVGEGVTGLSQAFLEAGSTCVLASLAGVPDQYASRFMRDVHERLAGGGTPAAALRAAQLAAREREADGPDADRWAEFVLVGAAVDIAERPSAVAGIGRGLLVAFALLLLAAALVAGRWISVSSGPRRGSNP